MTSLHTSTTLPNTSTSIVMLRALRTFLRTTTANINSNCMVVRKVYRDSWASGRALGHLRVPRSASVLGVDRQRPRTSHMHLTAGLKMLAPEALVKVLVNNRLVEELSKVKGHSMVITDLEPGLLPLVPRANRANRKAKRHRLGTLARQTTTSTPTRGSSRNSNKATGSKLPGRYWTRVLVATY